MTTDQRRLELKVQDHGNGRVSQRLVFEGTQLDVGHQVYEFHNRLAAVGYAVKVKTASIDMAQKAGYPMYGIVKQITGTQVMVEEMRTSPRDAEVGKTTPFERAFFLEHYEVD